jgi:hypothetical protein
VTQNLAGKLSTRYLAVTTLALRAIARMSKLELSLKKGKGPLQLILFTRFLLPSSSLKAVPSFAASQSHDPHHFRDGERETERAA